MFRTILCICSLAVMASGGLSGAETEGETKPKPETETPKSETETQQTPAVAEPATYHAGDLDSDAFQFSFRDARWERVLHWFAEKTGLTLDLTDQPPGSFNYVDDREHTASEALDVLNGYLLPRGYVALRRDQFLVVLSTENEVLPNLIPTVPTEKLDEYSNNELLRVVVPVKGFKPSEVAEQVEQFLGSFGKASPMDASEAVLLQGFGKSLRVAVAMLESVVAPAADDELEFKAFPLKHIPAADAERQIQKLFGIGGNPFAASQARRQAYLDRRARGRSSSKDRSEDRTASPLMQNVSMNMKVSSLSRTNSLLVTATPSAIKLVENILTSIDVRQGGGEEDFLDDSTPELRVYIVKEADEDDVAETIDAIMPGVVINEDGRHDSVHVYATAKEHQEVEKLIKIIDQAGTGGSDLEIIRLVRSDPDTMKDLLSSLFSNESKSNRPVITPDLRTNSLAIRATGNQMVQIKKMLAAYGETGGQRPEMQAVHSSRFRKLSIPNGRAEWIARAVKDMLADDGQFGNPIRVVVPSEVSDGRDGKRKVERDDSVRTERDSSPENKLRVHKLGCTPGDETADTIFASTQNEQEEPSDEAESRQTDRSRVTIEVRDGELFMYSNDGTALDQIEDTIRELVRQMPTRTDWTVFYLRAAKASETADQLGQLLQDDSNPYVGVGLPSGAENSFGLEPQPVRIIPDSRTNALFISGPESKIDEAERFLKLLDTTELPQSLRARVPRTIAVKHADVNAVAEMVRELYKDYLEDPNERRRQRRDDRRSSDRDRRRSVEVQREGDTPEPSGIRLTVSVDTRSNELLVSCDETLFQQIKELVEERDQAALANRPQLQIINLQEGTAESLVESLDSLSPRISVGTTTPPTSSRSSSRSRSFRYSRSRGR